MSAQPTQAQIDAFFAALAGANVVIPDGTDVVISMPGESDLQVTT